MVRINVKSTLWFILHPAAWRDYCRKVFLAVRKRITNQERANQWCSERAVDVKELVTKITGGFREIKLDGVSGHSNALMLYNLAEFLQATCVLETGVYIGESSYGILESLKNRNGKLISTDIPQPEEWVQTGSVIPDELKQYWKLIQKPDRVALPKALKEMPQLDMCCYDSDKSYAGRMFAYPLLWRALRKDGIFFSDDINDNYGFRDFCQNNNLEPMIAKNGERYVGVVIKK